MEPVSRRPNFAPPSTPLTRRLLVYFRSGAYNHTQRLNLHALLGAQRADVGSIRAIWALQDKVALDADKEKALELRRELVAGQERVLWNPAVDRDKGLGIHGCRNHSDQGRDRDVGRLHCGRGSPLA
jgi:hypothetical protein